jgi:hypothetical protein
MDEQFDKQLKKAAQESYEVKTTANDVLSEYYKRQDEKKRHNYRVPFYSALAAFGAACLVLAIYVPLSLRKQTSSSSSINSSDFNDVPVAPLKTQEKALAYEVKSLYPLLTKAQTVAGFTEGLYYPKQEANEAESEAFENVVESYENVESPIHQAFVGTDVTAVVETGSFVGQKATYQYKVEIEDVGSLLYNTVESAGVWQSLSGELVDDGESLYTISGTNTVTENVSALSLTLTGKEGFYCTVEQNTTKGQFFLSYNVYASKKLKLAFSIQLQQWQHTKPAVVAKYYFASEEESGSFYVVKESTTEYNIYGTQFEKILLTYNTNERTYKYNDIVITED